MTYRNKSNGQVATLELNGQMTGVWGLRLINGYLLTMSLIEFKQRWEQV